MLFKTSESLTRYLRVHAPERLTLTNCPFAELPSLPSQLRELVIVSCQFTSISTEGADELLSLQITNCHQLRHIAELPESLFSLTVDNCPQLEGLPMQLPDSLYKLTLRRLPGVIELPPVSKSMQVLIASHLPNLTRLPQAICSLDTILLCGLARLSGTLYLRESQTDVRVEDCPGLGPMVIERVAPHLQGRKLTVSLL
ncbi:MAG: hypothetical protein Q8T09_01820 [Candidatus Melainabacteria bacterium]|nr:hypothetical protein [Candidatus Melainabacteria bacterium]